MARAWRGQRSRRAAQPGTQAKAAAVGRGTPCYGPTTARRPGRVLARARTMRRHAALLRTERSNTRRRPSLRVFFIARTHARTHACTARTPVHEVQGCADSEELAEVAHAGEPCRLSPIEPRLLHHLFFFAKMDYAPPGAGTIRFGCFCMYVCAPIVHAHIH